MSSIKHKPFILTPKEEGELQSTFYKEQPRIMTAEGLKGDFEIQVALPPTYHRDTDKVYPVLYVTDGSMMFDFAVSMAQYVALGMQAPEMVVVGVGAPRTATYRDMGYRRGYEFTPCEFVQYEGLGGDLLQANLPPEYHASEHNKGGGAPAFLEFLTSRVMPEIQGAYRVDPDEQTIYGFSGGGGFVGYALFAKPGAFSRYICGSPNLNTGNFEIFKMEERYAAEHDDLPASVFFCAGEQEIAEMGTWGIVSSMSRMAEMLSLRQYPSLKLYSQILPQQNHVNAIFDCLLLGLRAVWRPEMEAGAAELMR